MGQSGQLTFYRRERSKEPHRVLHDLIVLARPEGIPVISRTLVEDREWDRFHNNEDEVPREYLSAPLNLPELCDLYQEGKSLSVYRMHSQFGSRVSAAITNDIAEQIRGNFAPIDMNITIGFHDLWENAEHDEGLFLARPFVSVGFFGYGTPHDWAAFRVAVFAVPEVQAVKREIETVVGPLEQCIYWSV